MLTKPTTTTGLPRISPCRTAAAAAHARRTALSGRPGDASGSPEDSQDRQPVTSGAEFRSTHWSVVLAACHGAQPASAAALESLCRSYWPPLYAFVRRHGHGMHEAQDLTQEFFSRLLASPTLSTVHPAKGRFRSFLLVAMKHFLANEWDRASTLKRGAQFKIFSLDGLTDDERQRLEPADHRSPEKSFDRRWAQNVVARVNGRLRREYESAGQAGRFDALKVYLLNEYAPDSYASTAERLGLTESAVKSAIYKLRQRYAEMFRAEIARTVDTPEEVDQEIRALLAALCE